jgi:hypothetical protein
MLLVLASIIAIQSCKKPAPLEIKSYLAAMPETPVPANGTIIAFTSANQAINLSWAGTATDSPKWTVYFGTSDSPPQVATNVTTNTYVAHIGTTGGVYYWQVETTDKFNITTTSPVWEFDVNSAPGVPTLTTPANNATAVSKTVALVWTGTDPEEDDLKYDLYLGTTATPGPVATGLTDATYSPTLAYNTTYYWKVVAKDPYGGQATSTVFTFKTDVQQPDYSVFNGAATELWNTKSSTVTIQRLGTSNTLSIFLPLADGFVAAGYGTVYSGTHPIIINYDLATKAITSAKQLWCDSFIDPIEMGPLYLQISTGTIDPLTKKLTVKWVVSGNAYWGSDYTTGTTTYTMK